MFDPDFDLFLDVVAAGSISAAARARGASVASLSKRLARLERRLGVRLAQRTTRRFALSAAGRDLVETLLPMRAGLQAAEDRIAGRGGRVVGPLRLSAPTSYGRIKVLPCLSAFLAAHPEIELSVDLSDQFIDLLDGTYDVAVRIGARVDASLVGHRLASSSRVLCASPGYLQQFGTPQSLRDLATHQLLAAEGQLPWRLQGPEGTVIHNGQSCVRTNSSEVVRELALGGCGIALRSLWDISEALADGRLLRVLPQYEGSRDVGVWVVHAPAPQVPARVAVLVEHLRAHLSDEGN